MISQYTRGSYKDHIKAVRATGSDPRIAAQLKAHIRSLMEQQVDWSNKESAMTTVIIADVQVGSVRRYLLSGGKLTDRPYVEGGDGKSYWRVDLPRMAEVLPIGSAPAMKNVGGATIRAGVCTIIGRGGTGKTPLAHALASHNSEEYFVVRFGEPLSGYSTDERETADDLLVAMATGRDVVFDSVKDLLSSGGALMKSGLSRGALVQLSSWSIAAASLGCTMFVPINPSSNDDEVLQLLVEAARSNVTALLTQNSDTNWAYISRSGEGQMRDQSTISIVWNDGEIDLGNAGSRGIGKTFETKAISEDEFSTSLQRILRSNSNNTI